MTRHRDRHSERRREERAAAIGLRARVRPGYRLIVIDLSACGALVEGGRALRPGSRVDVHLETDARRETVGARVVRCAVTAIDSEIGVTYRAGLAFNEVCDWVREMLTPDEYGIPCRVLAAPTMGPCGGDRLPEARTECAETTERGAK